MSASPSPDIHLALDPDFAPALRSRGLDTFERWMTVSGDAEFDKPGLAHWRQRSALELEGRRLFIKRYRRPPLRAQLAVRLRGYAAVAAVEWHWLHHLRRLSIPVPAPVALGYARRAGCEAASFLVTAAAPGQSLEQWVRTHGAPHRVPWLSERAARDRLFLAVAQLVARLHEANLFHRDLYLSHIFAEPRPDGGVELTLIDLQRIVRSRLRRTRWQVKDLAALNYSVPATLASRADRMRWFKRYRRARRLSHADKTLLRRIAAKTARIARHDRRRRAALHAS